MKNTLFLAILISIALGIICGIFLPEYMLVISWIGQLFINILKLIVLPLIFCALVSAITSLSDKKIGYIGIATLTYVFVSLSIAATIGLLLLNIFKPGENVAASLILANATPRELAPLPFGQYILSLFPPNIVGAAARYEIMPIVFFSIMFSIACRSVGEIAKPVTVFFVGLRDILIRMVMWLMLLAPIGLFSLLGTAVAEASAHHLLLQSLKGMLLFILIFIFGLFLQILWQAILLALVTKRNLKVFFKNALDALLTAFATSSSMATLPITLVVAKKENINDEVARFVLPLATTINLSGTAMYEAVSALFFCQVLQYDLSIYSQIAVFITAILAGIGATGIPEGGLITMLMVLRAVNVPASAISLLLPFDRILDRFRTMTNVWGDLVCASVVDHFQKSYETKKSIP